MIVTVYLTKYQVNGNRNDKFIKSSIINKYRVSLYNNQASRRAMDCTILLLCLFLVFVASVYDLNRVDDKYFGGPFIIRNTSDKFTV